MSERVASPREFVRNLRRLRYRELTMTVATGAVVAATVGLFPGTDRVLSGVSGGLAPTELLALLLIATLAAVTKGAVGFGFALVATPLFATIIDPALAVVVLAVPPWMINVFQIGDTDTGLAYLREEWSLVVLAFVGSVAGVVFLARFRTGPLLALCIGLLLLAYVAFEVVTGFVVVERAHHAGALGGAGLVNGFLIAATNMGPVLPAYLHTFERDTERYVGGVSMVFAVVLTERLVQMYLMGLLTPYRLWLGATVAVASIGGLLLGTYLRRLELDRRRFDRAVTALLLIIGLNLLRKTIPALL
jgi:hypothetical protein